MVPSSLVYVCIAHLLQCGNGTVDDIFHDTVVHIFGTDVKKSYSLLSTDRPVCLSVPRRTTAALTSKIWRKIITYVDWNLERFAEWLCRTLVKTVNLTNHVSQIFSLPSTPSTSAARFFVGEKLWNVL